MAVIPYLRQRGYSTHGDQMTFPFILTNHGENPFKITKFDCVWTLTEEFVLWHRSEPLCGDVPLPEVMPTGKRLLPLPPDPVVRPGADLRLEVKLEGDEVRAWIRSERISIPRRPKPFGYDWFEGEVNMTCVSLFGDQQQTAVARFRGK